MTLLDKHAPAKTKLVPFRANCDWFNTDKQRRGVKIDNALTWSSHVTHVCRKMSKSTGIIKKVSKFLPAKTLCTLYNTLIYPYLSYCHLIWGKAANTHLERILLAQKRVVRIICTSDHDDDDEEE